MASLSLPRVLQQRKTSLDAEREQFEKFQSISISKAVNPSETPVKEKHVRSTIIGTYQEKNGIFFWMIIMRQPLQENRIVAWKFCHVLHKVLREGHPRVIPDSLRYVDKLKDIDLFWQHLREGYGRLIHLYIRLLITKLDFHKRNPRIPGNLHVTPEELEAIGENDINIYFQMSVEMFDYMDEILTLQAAVFGSLNLSRSNSMTPCGQCRLAPLIPCVQDASQLYDFCVKILFRLHGSLPADTLQGHRNRFAKQFRELKQFYNTIKHMQYFKHLITIPSLPENPPNFLIQAELRTYVTPVVVLPPEDPLDNESVVDSLIDTSDSVSKAVDHDSQNGSDSPTTTRDCLIDHLHQENGRQRQELQRLLSEHQNIVAEYRHRVLQLESALSAKGSEVIQEKQISTDLAKQKQEFESKMEELEMKNKALEEKFQKLKNVYSKLREEHIGLIRQKAEVDKQLGGLTIKKEQLERQTQEAVQRLEESIQGQATAKQEVQRVEKARTELDEVRKQFDATKTEMLALTAKIDFMTSEKAVVEGELHDTVAQKEELEARVQNLQSEFERIKLQMKADADASFYEFLLVGLKEAEVILLGAMHTIDNPAISAVTCTPDYFATLVSPMMQSVNDLKSAYSNYTADPEKRGELMKTAIHVVHLLTVYLIQAKSTSNTSTDIVFGDRIADECKQLGSQSLVLISYMKEKSASTNEQIKAVQKQLDVISSLVATMSKTQRNVEAIGNLVENELLSMDKAIEEAANRIQEMLDKTRAADSGIKLEVNGKILDSCTELMMSIRILVKKSRTLQSEIVAQGKGTASATEFYKRNHQWSEGLISAAKAIAEGAQFLLESADKVVSGSGKFEQLMVASQGIAASTAQLVVASRVKADRNSVNLKALSDASRDVTQAVGTVVATSKSCSALVEENDDLDVSGLSLHQAKRLEMEAQVRVLELEQALETERLRLSALRRRHYQMAGEFES